MYNAKIIEGKYETIWKKNNLFIFFILFSIKSKKKKNNIKNITGSQINIAIGKK